VARGFAVPEPPEWAQPGWLRVPVEIADRDAVLARAEAAHLQLGDWFVSPLHPVRGDLTPWGYVAGSCPVAERTSRRIVNLPTDDGIDDRYVARLFATLDLRPPVV
jgi:hypothetical protein